MINNFFFLLIKKSFKKKKQKKGKKTNSSQSIEILAICFFTKSNVILYMASLYIIFVLINTIKNQTNKKK